ncbi:hypothetical protein [Streptomyces sp. NPDC057696]|uniref:hypothetical protein n=1 Tax=Streptomyces sp. NPDC057696 TaxID=3346218 RepID=UPI0036B34749
MRAKRSFVLLGPGIVASLAFPPGIAAAASAASAPAQAAVAAPSVSGLVGQAAPPAPYPTGYDEGYAAGTAAREAGKPRSAIPTPPTAHTIYQGQYYAGFVKGYDEHTSVEEYAVYESTRAGIREYVERKAAAIDRLLNREPVIVAPLPKDQPMLPGITPPTHEAGQGTTSQGQDTGLQGPTESVTPTHEAGQGTVPQGQDTGLQGPTESVTPTHEAGQGTVPQGQDTGLQGPTESVTPTHETGQETAPQGQDTGAQYDTTFEDQGFGSEGGFYGE